MFPRLPGLLLPSSVFHRTATRCHSTVQGAGRAFGFTYRKSMTSKNWQSRQWTERNLDSLYSWNILTCSCRLREYLQCKTTYIRSSTTSLHLSNVTAFNKQLYTKIKAIRTTLFSYRLIPRHYLWIFIRLCFLRLSVKKQRNVFIFSHETCTLPMWQHRVLTFPSLKNLQFCPWQFLSRTNHNCLFVVIA